MPRLVRRCLPALLLAGLTAGLSAAAPAFAPGAAWAQGVERPAAADRRAILGTIQAQLDAFQRDDWGRAFSYASPRLRELFRTPENFIAMVRGGYMPVYRPRSVEFLETRLVDGSPVQAVRFVGPDGEAVIALYTMQQQPDGSWRIAAVRLLRRGEFTS